MLNILLLLIIVWLFRLELAARLQRSGVAVMSTGAIHEINRLAVQASNVSRMIGGGQREY